MRLTAVAAELAHATPEELDGEIKPYTSAPLDLPEDDLVDLKRYWWSEKPALGRDPNMGIRFATDGADAVRQLTSAVGAYSRNDS